MAKLIVETFQVVLGIDAADLSPTVYVRGLLNREDADAFAERLNIQVANGEMDATLVGPPNARKLFFVRNSPGVQERVITSQAPADVIAEVGGFRFSVPVYVKTQDDAGGNTTYVQIGVRSSTVIR